MDNNQNQLHPMTKVPILQVLASLMVLGHAGQVSTQSFIYSYEGNNYDSFFPPYDETSRITGSFALDLPLTIDLSSTVTVFSFTDDVAIRDQTIQVMKVSFS